MFRGGQPYTDFRAVNARDGRIRFEGNPFGVTLKADPTTISSSKKVYLCDADGSMFVKGYHVMFGTIQVTGTMSLVPTNNFMTGVASVSGVHTTSVIIANVYSTASASGIAVAGATCKTDGVIQFQLFNIANATIANGALYVNYMVLNPEGT